MRGGGKTIIPGMDIVVAVATIVIAWLVGMQYSPRSWGSDPVPYVLTALIFLPLAARRRVPVIALAVSTGMLFTYLALGYDQLGLNFWGPILLLYTVASLRPPKITAWCTTALVPVLLFAAKRTQLPWYVAVAEAVMIPVIAWSMGNVGRQLGLRNQQLAVLTEQLRIEQEARTERAVTDERVRIARELHDVVAHHMSVIAVQTGLAGYVFDDDPPTARAAVDTIAATSREALRDMRRLLKLLRTEDEPGDTALSLAHLPELVGRMRTAGLPVTLVMAGPDIEQLPSGLQACAYRVVQEALTNVMKHAGLAATNVLVRLEADQLTVRVANAYGTPSEPGPVGGNGLINMRERAALYQGTLSAGWRGDGGFVVELTLPIGPDDEGTGAPPAI
ncbi:signal transduction histidine kinase [Kibdelosporangium banguiense]|uniref:histidine kinase n=1 Tax=Kibdelosporangium banguiense TaxID=1365924 RepID=A0ABS4TKP7_9PSEU|nr:sensor histidine kinase [Kibdelosporangium banguiense]MBP2324987.1 signal transduction histidine kinase [Kibdelosporangium banguiense]